MAGGKETPRQKMIGMMYLVLTALLALNVSKSILDAFVAIEENIQTANLTELYRGDEKKAELKETATDKSNPERAAKADKLYEAVKRIDEMTAKRIKMIDDLKIKILDACGEDIKSIGKPESIITKAYNKNEPLRPARMNLEFVAGKDKYDEPMRIMGVAEDITKPKGDGLALWKSYNDFRAELTEEIARTQVVSDEKDTSGLTVKYDDKYFFKAPSINEFKDQKDLTEKVEKAVEGSNVHPDDEQAIIDIYKSLTKNERSEVHEVKGVHWVGKTFDHSPSVAAIASLSSLQKEVLGARAQALSLIRLRVGGGEYSFNKIMALAYGPEVVNANEEYTIEVLMAAYDSDKQPEVTLAGQKISEVRDGKGYVRGKAGATAMELKGEVTIRNKSGIRKTLPWTKTIQVMKPSGSIELLDLNVLYRGYPNRVNATASGYQTTQLTSGGNVNVSKSGQEWIAKPGGGKTAYLVVSGKDADGKTFQLKKGEYRVSNLPDPVLYWGAAKSGEKGSRSSRVLIAKYTPEIPLKADFRVTKWTATAPGLKGAPPQGLGGNLGVAGPLISNAPPGTALSVTATVVGPDGIARQVGGSWGL